MRRQRRHKPRISTFWAGLIGAVVIVLFSYGAYTKFANPFASPYTVHVIFSNANELQTGSLVRVAGVNVGKVVGVSPVSGCSLSSNSAAAQNQCSASDVTLAINGNGLPLHKDATFWIRPRIFLEGNFFVDVNQGTPEAPVAPSGYVFPIQQGIEPVQFDQVLTSLQANTRANLQTLLQQYGYAVKQGGPTYDQSIQYWTPAYKYGAEVAHDMLGTQPNDLSGWIDKGGVVNGALSQNRQYLENLITNSNTTAAAFARENTSLSAAVAELPRTLQVAMPALNALETALCNGPQVPNCSPGPLREFARGLVPGVRSTEPMVDASLPFFHQLRLLVEPSELGNLTSDLAQAIPAPAKLNQESIPFMRDQVRPASNCQLKVILPWTRMKVPDPNFNDSNGFPSRPVYVEGVDFLPGLAGESRDFDANGPYIRVFGTGGTLTYSLQPGLFGQSMTPISGVEPQVPAPHPSGDGSTVDVTRPPLMPDVPCETQPPIASLAAPVGTGPKQIQTGDSSTASTLMQQLSRQAVSQITAQAQQQGLRVRLVDKPPTGK